MALWLPLVALTVTGVSLLLAGLSLLTAVRTDSVRFGFAAGAFGVLALRGVWVFGDGAGWFASPMPWDAWTVGTDALVVALLYFAVVKG